MYVVRTFTYHNVIISIHMIFNFHICCTTNNELEGVLLDSIATCHHEWIYICIYEFSIIIPSLCYNAILLHEYCLNKEWGAEKNGFIHSPSCRCGECIGENKIRHRWMKKIWLRKKNTEKHSKYIRTCTCIMSIIKYAYIGKWCKCWDRRPHLFLYSVWAGCQRNE